MNWKKLFSISVKGNVEHTDSATLERQINNNLTVMHWMYFVLLMTLSAILVMDGWLTKIFFAVSSVLILVFINSLHLSQKMNKIILEIRGR